MPRYEFRTITGVLNSTLKTPGLELNLALLYASVVVGGVGTMLVALTWFKLFPSLAQRDRLVVAMPAGARPVAPIKPTTPTGPV